MRISARGWEFEIKDPTAAVTTWVEIGGVNNFDLDESENNEQTETTEFADRGRYTGRMMQRGASLELEGNMRKQAADPARKDPGQQLVDALGDQVDEESVGTIRMRHETDDEWIEWDALVEKGSKGGGNNDKTTWAATFTQTGWPRVTDLDGNPIEDETAEAGA